MCYCTAISGNFPLTFENNLSVSSLGVKNAKGLHPKNTFGFLTSEDGTDMLFRNVGKKLPLLADKQPRRARFSSSMYVNSSETPN
jgi:hypothetical protein